MADLTLTQAQAQLDAYLACSLAIAGGAQSYAIGNRSLTRADLGEVRAQIDYWRGEVRRLAAIAAGDTGAGVLRPAWR